MTDPVERFAAEYHAFHSISAARGKEQVRLLRAFEAFAGVPLTQTTDSDLRAFLADLITQGFHPNTVRKKAGMIRPFYGWAFDARLIGGDDYMRVTRVRNPRGASSQSRPKPYERKQIVQFWTDLDASWPLNDRMVGRWSRGIRTRWWWVYRHAMHVQIEAIAMLALHAGMRRDEIFNAALDDIHYDNAYVVIRHGAKKNAQGEVKPREVPMTAQLALALERWFELRAKILKSSRGGKHDSPWLSLTHTGAKGKYHYKRAISHKRFSALLGTVGKGYELHRLRHTCATEWLRAGVPLEQVQRLMGHSRLQQTLCYAELVKTDLEKAMGNAVEEFQTAVGRAA